MTDYENYEEPSVRKNGVAIAGFVVSIIGAITLCGGVGVIIDVVGLILSIIGLAKKNAKKGFAIAGLIISIIGLLIGCVFVGIMAPQLIKYDEKAGQASDAIVSENVKSAIQTMIYDPDLIMNYPEEIDKYSDGSYYSVSGIEDGKFKDGIEEILGMPVEEVGDKLNDGNEIFFSINGTSVDVKIE